MIKNRRIYYLYAFLLEFTALRERESPRFQSWDESDMLKNLNYFRIYSFNVRKYGMLIIMS